eukprot:gene8158-9031_t
MSNKPENVPIATLSGLSSLSDVLKDFPMPGVVQNDGRIEHRLLSSPEMVENAKRLLNGEHVDGSLLEKIQCYLSKVNTQYLDFKTHQRKDQLNTSMPILLQQLLVSNPNAFAPAPDHHFNISPSKHMQYPTALQSPYHGPLQQHIHPPILSPTRSGHNIPIAHVSPLQKTHSQIAPVAHVPPYNVSTSSKMETALSSHQKGPSMGTEQHEQAAQNVPARRRLSLASRDQTRKHTFQEAKFQEQDTEVDQHSQKRPISIDHLQQSPGSLKVSINKQGLSCSPAKRGERQQFGGSAVRVLDLDKDAVTPAMDVDRIGNDGRAKGHNLPPTDVLISAPEQMMRPVIPKIVVKKVRRKEGSKEFETMEIITPDKEIRQVIEISSSFNRDGYSTSVSGDRCDDEAINASRKKRRRLSSSGESEDENFTDNLHEGLTKKKKRSKVRLVDQDVVVVRADVKRFLQIVQGILDFDEELESEGVLNYGEDCDVPQESLLSRSIITDLYMETSKLKSADLASQIPHDLLVRVISIMDRHVKECNNVILAHPKADEDEEEKLWKALKIDRVLRATEASLVILHVTTAPGMPKQVYIEEAIEHVVSFCRFQLENTIYPEYDPVYRVEHDSRLDASSVLPKARRGKNTAGSKQKPILQLYNKLCEMVSLIGDLVSMESLTDMIILQVSSIGTVPFFVENISILQLEALKLVRTVFRNYVKHRDLILSDILASLARLPSSKRNLRNYRLFEDTSIQMVTALVLQLVQCTVSLPDTFEAKEECLVDKDVMIVTSYEDSLRAAQNFIATFLKKCSTASKDENDFRPLFENFLHDLLTTMNKPEWPAAEVLLTLLGKLLIVTFNNKSNEMSLRVAAMDYMSLIASHLRRDAVESRDKDSVDLREIIQQLIAEDDIEDDISIDMIDIHINTLRKALLNYLSNAAETDVSCKFSREFYLGQWIRDVHVELEKCMRAPMMSIPGAASNDIPTDDPESSVENIQELEEKKIYYHSLATDNSTTTFRSSQQKISYQESCIISKYLSSTRTFCQSFDIYLQQIFKMLNEQAVALRTKAVKALTSIVSTDPNILGREDVQVSVHCRFRDQSTLVREAAVDLIGQFVLKCPDLTDKYYDMIMERILDTGISVRKRVIKILRDICIEQPDFNKIPEICMKIIRRINDEEGIRDLVTKVFHKMWFTPVTGNTENNHVLLNKTANIIKVVAMCKDTGYDWFENLLDNLFESDDDNMKKSTINACQQLTDCLVQKLLKTDQSKGAELVPCLTTLYLLCKVRPQLLVHHATTFQPYLSIKCNTQGDALVVQNVAKILENVVPLVEHPNPKFLADLEEDLMKLLLKQGQNIVQSCVGCLDAVINHVTHNYKFIADCFKRFHAFLDKSRKEHGIQEGSKFAAARPGLLRSLFIAGLLCKHFDFDKHINDTKKKQYSLDVLEISLFFTKHPDEEVRLKAIMAVGFICVSKPEYLLRNECKQLYQNILSVNYKSARGKCMLLKGLLNHLMEEEARMHKLEGHKKKGRKNKQQSDIKEFGDVQSGTTSAVMQVLLKNIMESFLHVDAMVRLSAVQVVALILKQGLIHPAQCVPYLIAATTDDDKLIKAKSEQSLTDIHSRHSGFLHMKAVQGVKLAYRLQFIIQQTGDGYLQGFREADSNSAMISHIYTLLRSNKQYRRPFLQSLVKQFDDQKSSIDMLFFFAENLAYLPYVTQEEPLFVMHHCDMLVSVVGATYLQSFQEVFFPARKGKGKGKSPHNVDDDEELDNAAKLVDMAVDLNVLQNIVKESFGCMLLLELKQSLKQLYGFADSKCQKYSPSEPSKLYDKSMTRRGDMVFDSYFKDLMFKPSELDKDEIVNYYLQFKQMMLSLDSEEDSEEIETKAKQSTHIKQTNTDDNPNQPKETSSEITLASTALDLDLHGNPEQMKTASDEDADDDVKSEGSNKSKSRRNSRRNSRN